jgi:hypothetical protein
MKQLYRILRLFFCPHKYTILECSAVTRIYKNGSEVIIGHNILSQCKYCGKLSTHKDRIH